MARRLSTWLWILAILGLLALRIPAWAAPVGSDQYLYLYVADRLLEGGVPYVDAWDQKPPAVFFLYALLRAVWPYASVVALADLISAAVLAWALVTLGRQTIGTHAGWAAAALALLFGHPSFSRLSGVYVRGQCEAFIAPAVTCALVLLTRADRRHAHFLLAGSLLAIAFWLKYNALAYALPVVLAALVWTNSTDTPAQGRRAELWMGALGFAIPSLAVLAYFAAHGALGELRLATLDYNLQYSRETYDDGAVGALKYLAFMPLDRAREDFLWFLGGTGGALLLLPGAARDRRVSVWALGWLAAAVMSIAINGARDLPQYFVQAVPALAFAACAGASVLWRRGSWGMLAGSVVLVAGLWKVGVEAPSVAGLRWAGLPQLAENVGFDAAYLLGRTDIRAYLARFKGIQKYDALATYDLTQRVRDTTAPGDRVLVFGFAPGVYVESGRPSPSRFFWSRPVIVEFAADRPGYGSAGLLRDLVTRPPTVVALQKRDWEDRESAEFFLATPALRNWLAGDYALESDMPTFSVWRRRN